MLSVPNSPYGLCGRKATFEEDKCELCVSFSFFLLYEFSSVQFSSTWGGFSELGKSLFYRHSIQVWQKFAQHQLEPD